MTWYDTDVFPPIWDMTASGAATTGGGALLSTDKRIGFSFCISSPCQEQLAVDSAVDSALGLAHTRPNNMAPDSQACGTERHHGWPQAHNLFRAKTKVSRLPVPG